ncbi:MAG: peptidase associated/transthyretin-like domain-containing protein, partial [Vulcanimicrobiaceae bacterium]
MLVDDPSGSPLAGIPVKLEPWVAGATPLPSPQATTAANGTFSIGPVANGHYLLVIGSDSPSDITRPTIHDNVTLTGGTQALAAPNLTVTPYGPIPTVTPPAVETNGDYRLDTLSPTDEVACLQAFNQQRLALNLVPVVADEWLTENAREWNAFRVSGQFAALQPTLTWYGLLTTGNTVVAGGSSCAQALDGVGGSFTGSALPYSGSANTQWFG